jgi:hypothetical protein
MRTRAKARIVIDACKPWARRDRFPIEARPSKELDAHVRAKFATFLPRGRGRGGRRPALDAIRVVNNKAVDEAAAKFANRQGHKH